jgi:hypothetical protein
MLRTALGAVVGAVVWMLVALGLGFLIGQLWPEFAAASRNPPTLTLAMLVTRLGLSFIGSLIGGAVAGRIGGAGSVAALASGLLLLVVWAPYHILSIWHLFPVWYHLTFFVSLPLFAWLGGRVGR